MFMMYLKIWVVHDVCEMICICSFIFVSLTEIAHDHDIDISKLKSVHPAVL